MRNVNDPRQKRLIDVYEGVISEAGWRMIADGWQGVVRHVVLHELPALRLGDDLDEFLGRPSAELFSMSGLLLLREFFGWTMPQAHEAILFRTDVQYALNLEPGFEISQRTIERYQARLVEDGDLAADLLTRVTDRLVCALELNVSRQRLDSTHVFSDMASFGRTRMMGVAVKRFLVQVRRHQPEDYAGLPEEFRTRYEQSVGRLFGDTKTPEARQRNRQQAAEDLQWIIQRFAAHEAIPTWPIYQQLVTIFQQQCEVVEERLEVRKQTGGAVIQNPSDPDATYSGHKGLGYQVQLSETCHPANEQQLIIAAIPQTAVTNDAQAVVPVMDDLQARGHQVETLLADCGYGGDENVQAAAARNITLVSPVPGGAQYDPEAIGPEHFRWDRESQTVTACPAGHAPQSSVYNAQSDRVAVTMSLEVCAGCPLLERCAIKRKRKSAKIYFQLSEHRAGTRRQDQQTEAFRTAYAPRAGIESTNSGLKRRMGLGRLRVRGQPAVATALLLKIAGWNIARASQTQNMRDYVRQQMLQEGRSGLARGFGALWANTWTSLPTLRLAICDILSTWQPTRWHGNNRWVTAV